MKYILQFLVYFKKLFWCSAIGVIIWLFTSFSQSFLKLWPNVSSWMDFYLRNNDGSLVNAKYMLVQSFSYLTGKIEVLLSQLNYWLPLEDIFNNFMGLVGFCVWLSIVKVVLKFALNR